MTRQWMKSWQRLSVADGIQIKSNLNDVLKDIAEWKEEVAVRTVRRSIGKCAARANDILKPLIPVFTGKLRFNTKVTSAKYIKRRGVTTAKVGIDTVGKADNPRNAFYWRFVEFGHKTRPSKKGNGTQREVPPQHFVQAASARVQSTIAAIFFADLERATNRAGKKIGVQVGE